MGFAFFTTPCLKFARPPKPLLLYVSIKCDGSLFLYAGMTMNFLYLSPIPPDRWMASELQFSSEKGAAHFQCQMCFASSVTHVSVYALFIYMVFIFTWQ